MLFCLWRQWQFDKPKDDANQGCGLGASRNSECGAAGQCRLSSKGRWFFLAATVTNTVTIRDGRSLTVATSYFGEIWLQSNYEDP